MTARFVNKCMLQDNANTKRDLAYSRWKAGGYKKRPYKGKKNGSCKNGRCFNSGECIEYGTRVCFWRIYGDDRVCLKCEEKLGMNVYRP